MIFFLNIYILTEVEVKENLELKNQLSGAREMPQCIKRGHAINKNFASIWNTNSRLIGN